ncbi:cyclophilin-like fold protein [Candidatus Omnitrophota bacterium]
MAYEILITAGAVSAPAQLNDSKTAEAIYAALPLESRVNTWGEEIYCNIPVMVDLENDFAKDVVELGALGYWPQGPAFCIFFGQTPVSTPEEIRPATAVNVIGKVKGDVEGFKTIKDGEKIKIVKES